MQSHSLLKQYSKNKACYYCGAPPPCSKEHAPIKSMFEAFECDSITVPSCERHSTAKNLDDRAILAFFIKGFEIRLRYRTLTENMLMAFNAAAEKLGYAREVTSKPLVVDLSDQLNIPLPHIDAAVRVIRWMRQLTAALVWSATGDFDPSSKWDEAVVWSPDYVQDTELRSITEAGSKLLKLKQIKASIDRLSLYWWPAWTSFPRPYPPDIYHFEVSFLPTQDLLQGGQNLDIVFRHWFYADFSWYVWFTTSHETKERIASTVKKLAEPPPEMDDQTESQKR